MLTVFSRGVNCDYGNDYGNQILRLNMTKFQADKTYFTQDSIFILYKRTNMECFNLGKMIKR